MSTAKWQNIAGSKKFFSYCAGTKSFGAAPNAIQFLVWSKKFGPAQNILGPVEGQGTRQRILIASVRS